MDFCHRPNHTMNQCFALNKLREEGAKGANHQAPSDPNVNFVQQVNNNLDTVDTNFTPFCSKAVIFCYTE